MRYLVIDESNEVLRKFATKHEAQYFIKERPELWIQTLPKVKTDRYALALNQLGYCLF